MQECVMSEAVVLQRPGLYIGGLRNDLHPGKLAGLICSLLWRFQVQLHMRNVHINCAKKAYAIVDLPDEEISKYLLSELSSLDNVQNVFDLSTITNNPCDFRVGPKLTEGSKRHRSRSRGKRKKREKPAANTASNAAANSPSDHTINAAGSVSGKSTWAPTKKQTGDSPWLNNSANGKEMSAKRAGASQSSVEDVSTSQSESEAESDYTSAPSQSVSKVFSSSTASSKESDDRLHDVNGRSLANRSSGLQAGGVRRLVQELNIDGVARSASDRNMYSPMAKKSATTSTTGLPVPGQVSVTTSTPGTGTGMAIGFYRLGETVGRESRHSEFKQGGMAHKDRTWLQETVGKYVCGFLNSSEGGTLYIGVNDKGIVTGFFCPQSKEDHYRLLIDEALKSIDPPIFTDAYVVSFKPIMEDTGRLSETHCVLEIEVKGVKHRKNLYDFRGNAFLRRDGSLQGPLKARQVQEWTRMQLERENSGSQLKSQLDEMTSQLEKEREKNARMQEKLTQLEGYVSEVKLKRTQSKICIIM